VQIRKIFKYILYIFCGEGPRSRSYGSTAALRLIVQTCDEDEEKGVQFFLFFQIMKYRCNETDRGKTEVLGAKPVPVPFFFNGSTAPWGPRPPHVSRLHYHTF
jgi:hypothetical protein